MTQWASTTTTHSSSLDWGGGDESVGDTIGQVGAVMVDLLFKEELVLAEGELWEDMVSWETY